MSPGTGWIIILIGVILKLSLVNGTCGNLRVPDFSTHNLTGLSPPYPTNTLARFSCVDGFEPSGSPFLTCQLDGTWLTAEPFVCTVKSCGNPGTVPNARKGSFRYSFGRTVTYRCDPGYEMRGHPTLRCLATRKWSHPLPTCTVKSCGNPGTVPNARKGSFRYSFGRTVTYRCDPGYEMRGHPTLRCLATRKWSHPLPTCTAIKCPELQPPDNGRLDWNKRTYGSTVTLQCDPGYRTEGETTAVCQENQQWSNQPFSCIPIECPELQAPVNGSLDSSMRTYGSTVTLQCNAGYRAEGGTTAVCQENQQWSNQPFSCVPIECPELKAPDNGSLYGNKRTFSSTVTLQCNAGYRAEGETTAVCQENQQWSNQPFSCMLTSCGDPGRVENGYKASSRYSVGRTVTYRCHRGYEMRGQPTLRCRGTGKWSHPLPTCTARAASVGSPPGRVGERRQDVCHCKNPASCDKPGGTCDGHGCAEGFKGDNCHVQVADVTVDPWVLIGALVVIWIMVVAGTFLLGVNPLRHRRYRGLFDHERHEPVRLLRHQWKMETEPLPTHPHPKPS